MSGPAGLPAAGLLIAAALLVAAVAAAAGPPRVRLEKEPGSDPAYLTVAGDYLYFTADDGFRGRAIWALDGDGWVAPQTAFSPDAVHARLSILAPMGDEVLFLEENTQYLYRTRTGRGPAELVSVTPESASIADAVPLDGVVFFLRKWAAGRGALWYVDRPGADARAYESTAGGEVDVPPSSPLLAFPDGITYHRRDAGDTNRTSFGLISGAGVPERTLGAAGDLVTGGALRDAVCNERACYLATDTGLWRVDPVSLNAVRLSTDSREGGKFQELTLVGERLFFRAESEGAGSELWTSDGSVAGTHLVRDIYPGVSSSGPFYFAPLRDGICFTAKDAAHGSELWYSDGTEAGTVLVKDLVPGSRSSEPYQLTAYNDHVYFSCYNDTYGEELWRTDGTGEGTHLVADIHPGPGDSEPYYLTVFNDALYFAATDGVNGFEVWRTRGTWETTEQVTRIRPPASIVGASSPRELTALADKVYFTAAMPGAGRMLCASDGTVAGTGPVLSGPAGSTGDNPRALQVHDGVLYYQGGLSDAPVWWRIVPEPGVPERAASPPPEPPATLPGAGEAGVRVVPGSPVALGARYLFAGYTPAHGIEPWLYDPASGAFTMLYDIFQGPASSSPSGFSVHGGEAYFIAYTAHGGTELFRTDGTPAGLEQLWDMHDTPLGSVPYGVHARDGGVSALVRVPETGFEVTGMDPCFRTPQWLSPYVVPNEFAVAGARAFIVCDTPASGAELWGIALGHRAAYRVRDLAPNVVP